jgi:hypothetical protein
MPDRAAQEITPQMIEAGVSRLAYYDSRDTFPDDQADLVTEIFMAMELSRVENRSATRADLGDVEPSQLNGCSK